MLNNRRYDIAIVGGGLAGLSLAIQAADKGYNVALFEKEQYPFHKVCGEYISFESKHFLERLGVPLDEWKLPAINKLKSSDCSGKEYSFSLPLGGLGVSRFKLDNELYSIALQKEVDVFTNTKVTSVVFKDDFFEIHTSKGEYNASIAAGCFGKRSNIDVKLNRSFIKQKSNKLNNYIGIKYHVNYSQPADTIALHNFENGYCGISQIEDEKCCLCYLTTANNLSINNNSIPQMEKNVLHKNKAIKNIFEQATFLYEQPLAISQISFNKKTQVEDHVLMVGNSAGLITPLCGNGMSMALHASKLAYEVIHLFLTHKIERNNMERMYINSWKNKFKSRLQTGRIVQSMFGSSLTTSLFLKTMDSLPFVANTVIRSTHGEPF